MLVEESILFCLLIPMRVLRCPSDSYLQDISTAFDPVGQVNNAVSIQVMERGVRIFLCSFIL